MRLLEAALEVEEPVFRRKMGAGCARCGQGDQRHIFCENMFGAILSGANIECIAVFCGVCTSYCS